MSELLSGFLMFFGPSILILTCFIIRYMYCKITNNLSNINEDEINCVVTMCIPGLSHVFLTIVVMVLCFSPVLLLAYFIQNDCKKDKHLKEEVKQLFG